ncbi:hypothetical protein IWW56_005757, partial [Coemansia sp. RSA 2131]
APELLPEVPDMLRENCVAQGISTTGNALGDKGPLPCDAVAEDPTPYADQFESLDPPSGWKLVSYMLHGGDDDID